jgi:hypothetical protein
VYVRYKIVIFDSRLQVLVDDEPFYYLYTVRVRKEVTTRKIKHLKSITIRNMITSTTTSTGTIAFIYIYIYILYIYMEDGLWVLIRVYHPKTF